MSHLTKLHVWVSDTPMDCECCGDRVPAHNIRYRDTYLTSDLCMDCARGLWAAEAVLTPIFGEFDIVAARLGVLEREHFSDEPSDQPKGESGNE